MAVRKKQVRYPDSKSARGARSSKATRFGKVAEGSAQIVKDAAALLDEELSAGILAAKQVQQRFQKEKRLDASDFKDPLAKFQSDAHELVAQLSHQVEQLGSKENAELANRLLRHTHDMVDVAADA